MKVRMRFSKTGALVYIGHLDVMRYFQKLLRRAGIPVAYSNGFSPHQLLSFTPPLPLGMESTGEYADVELTGRIDTETALKRLRAESVKEISIMSFKELPEKCENAMAAVRAAKYSVCFRDGSAPFDLEEAVSTFLASGNVMILKKTKKNERQINIRPLVYSLSADNGTGTINMLISSGSTDNIKPELVLCALARKSDAEDTFDTVMKRIDQFTGDELISLDETGTDIL